MQDIGCIYNNFLNHFWSHGTQVIEYWTIFWMIIQSIKMKKFSRIWVHNWYHWKNLEWLGFNGICFIIFRPKVLEMLKFQLFLSLKFQINFKNLILEGKISSIIFSNFKKACLPCNLGKISFDIFLFKNWIYTLHNNVHMLNSLYINVMGSHLDQPCMPHYIPCKTMFVCFHLIL